MRTVFAISTAIAFFISATHAANADFNPVNFAAQADSPAVPLTNSFTTFRWKGEEAVAKESFELEVDDAARIQVTDYKNRGDSFEIFDNGVSIGTTNKVDVNKDEQVFAATPEEALNDERFSKGVFDLAKGSHVITIKATGPYEAGTAAIRLMDRAGIAFLKKSDKNKHDDDKDDGDDKDDDDKDDDDKDDDKDQDDEDEEKDYGDKKKKKKWGKKKSYHHKEEEEEDKYPGHGLDLSHTITITKTKTVVVKATHSSH